MSRARIAEKIRRFLFNRAREFRVFTGVFIVSLRLSRALDVTTKKKKNANKNVISQYYQYVYDANFFSVQLFIITTIMIIIIIVTTSCTVVIVRCEFSEHYRSEVNAVN